MTFGSQVSKKARTKSTPDAAQVAKEPDPNAPISGQVCLGNDQPAECKEVVNVIPEAPKLLFVVCAQATVKAINASPPDFSTQPNVCRTAAAGISNFLDANQATLDDRTQRLMRVAAATAFDFAGVGYEMTQGKLSADHCAAIEGVFTTVVGPDRTRPTLPTRVHNADVAVLQCRAKFDCSGDSQKGIVCTAKEAAPTAPAPPAVTPAP